MHARVYDAMCGWSERHGLLEWRRFMVGDLTGEVVELGCGTGKNFRHYPAEARVLASDLDPVMLSRAVERADRSAAEVRLFLADAMRLPLRDGSVDTVVIGLMLCSVPDQGRAIAEVRRVLGPGGRLRFVEHVRDEDGRFRSRVQDFVNPVWRTISGGCNANRRTVEALESAGFGLESLYRFNIGHTHVAPHVMGEAVVR